MKLIAHRGNRHGPNSRWENKITYLELALKYDYDIEFDVWALNGNLFLGHDGPSEFLGDWKIPLDRSWIHAKNYAALRILLDMGANCFYHDKDKYTLTSKGFIWAYPGSEVGRDTILVMPELADYPLDNTVTGVCSDYISRYR